MTDSREDKAPLVSKATDGIREWWTVRFGSEGNYYYQLFRCNLITASENELSPAEKVVSVLAAEVMRLSEGPLP